MVYGGKLRENEIKNYNQSELPTDSRCSYKILLVTMWGVRRHLKRNSEVYLATHFEKLYVRLTFTLSTVIFNKLLERRPKIIHDSSW